MVLTIAALDSAGKVDNWQISDSVFSVESAVSFPSILGVYVRIRSKADSRNSDSDSDSDSDGDGDGTEST
jgi:hypothetical protein